MAWCIKIVTFHQFLAHLSSLSHFFYRNSHPLFVALRANLPRSNGNHRQDDKCPARKDVHLILQNCFKTAAGRGSASARKFESPPVMKPLELICLATRVTTAKMTRALLMRMFIRSLKCASRLQQAGDQPMHEMSKTHQWWSPNLWCHLQLDNQLPMKFFLMRMKWQLGRMLFFSSCNGLSKAKLRPV